MKRALRWPALRRSPGPSRRRVAKSERSNRTASSGGVAAHMASSFHLAMSLATHRLLTLGDRSSPLLWSTHRPPMGARPVTAQHSATGRTSQTRPDSMNRISSIRARCVRPAGSVSPDTS